MPFVRSWRNSRPVVGATVASVLSVVALVPAFPTSAGVITGGDIVVSSPVSGAVAANTPNLAILLELTAPAGITLGQDLIEAVDLGADRCRDLEPFLIPGTSLVLLTTPDNAVDDSLDGCAPTADPTVGETVTITFANGGSDTWAKTGSGLVFVEPPAIAAAHTNPVFTENSAALPAGSRVTRLLSTGDQRVRITAAHTFAFSGGADAGLAVTVGGEAATEVTAWSRADPTTPLTGPASDDDKGNTLSFRTAADLTASADPSITITQNGISQTFTAADTGLTIVAAPVVTGVSPGYVRAGSTATVTLIGTGFAAGTTATVCGDTVSPGEPNADGTSMTISVDTTEIVDDADGLGIGTFAGVCPVVLTADSVDSPISDRSAIAILSE
ncbi:hypothetical protein GCM10009557_32410 [Virgisporangium ochraceum]|uniref:IPT/TIG domain-containing protein n=1 Tax=Virgisporangium ochraceum TaxID=65505 RepID=A0A8J3ZYU7_9ACTN|nr:hypothetical protein [Virgisporangium ochraceum]GIJ70748.1 hypothetical protein Voc01_056650 [Virgisporangium ochraceum]